ncbi:MAG: hypothetical protein IJ937_02450 [Treponema sp.]|nr:hypothetical protein [Treponema sp.]
MYVGMKAYDSNDWLADPFVKENHVVYPYGAENARITERAAATGDVVLFDNDKAAMILTKFYEDEIWGYSVDAYLVNKTDKNLMFSVDGATVNGFICDPFWACEVKGGMRAYSTISWMESSFEENDIDQVEKIMLSVGVSDAEDWMADAIVKEQFTLVP